MEAFNYQFTALRGMQAGREYYVVMYPPKLIPKIFLFDEEEIPPELRAQRVLNRARVPEIARYILDNPAEYVFSSITASISAAQCCLGPTSILETPGRDGTQPPRMAPIRGSPTVPSKLLRNWYRIMEPCGPRYVYTYVPNTDALPVPNWAPPRKDVGPCQGYY